jgi:LmbE family N-acetylglucosaminyl deacetylase
MVKIRENLSKAELSFLLAREGDSPRVMIVSPHPDDEVIGAGSRLPLLNKCVVVQVTDGSPCDLNDAIEAGFATREEYAQARGEELRHALALAGVQQTIKLGIPDQRASFEMPRMIRDLGECYREFEPDYVLTVPYEGGHPDHDATAFAVLEACREIEPWKNVPRILEMLSYHEQNGVCEMESFLNERAGEVLTVRLSAEERAFKDRLFKCFKTQARVLRWFPLRLEKFRAAPQYNFSAPPHPGRLYYEKFPWGVDGLQWRELADEALRQRMGVPHGITAG